MSIMSAALNDWLRPDTPVVMAMDNISIMYSLDRDVTVGNNIRIDRIWAMPSKDTFTIKPIAELLKEEIGSGTWVDPFAGYNSPAEITNDLNPTVDTDYHMEAIDFLKMLGDASVDGVLYDPPYSAYQAKAMYEIDKSSLFGYKAAKVHQLLKNEVARIIKPGGKVICFGWTSMGLGKSRGFVMNRILLVPHGAMHNDTIVTVETKE